MSAIPQDGTVFRTIKATDMQTQGPGRAVKTTDEIAVALVVQDARLAEAWMDQKQWTLNWRETDILYQSPRTLATWENSTVTKANVSRFTVAKHVNTLVPSMIRGIFYEAPPFQLRPRGHSKASSIRAKQSAFATLLDEMEFQNEAEAGCESQCLNGTGIWKWGWQTTFDVQKTYVRKKAPIRVKLPFTSKEMTVHTAASDEFEIQDQEVEKNRPFFESKELGTFMPAPGWRARNQIWKAKYVIERSYMDFYALNELRWTRGYNLPPEAELKKWWEPPVETAPPPSAIVQQQQSNAIIHHAQRPDEEESKDPLAAPLEVLERWDKKTVKVVVNGKHCIRNEEHGLGRIPYLSANWWNIQNAGYGLGVGRLVGTDQRVEQGSTNAALDILSMAVNQQYARSRGANVPTQQIRSRLGGIIDVDGDVDKAFKIIDPPKVPAEVWTTIQVSKQASESVSGADEAFVQGGIPNKGGSSVVRTATGAGGVAAASAGRIEGPVGRFVNNVLIPFLYIMDDMVNERMPLAELRALIADDLGDDFEFDTDDYLNSKLKFEVLAGARLAAKKAMAQSLPLMVQILENPELTRQLNQTGWVIDVREIFEMFMEMSEWKNNRSLIRKMNAQEQQMYQQFNSAMQKNQQELQKINAKHAAKKDEIDQSAEARLAHDLILNAGERAGAHVEREVFEKESAPFYEEGVGQ